MSVFQYKAKAFGGGESSSSSDDDVSDGEFERELERQRRAEAEAKEKKGKGKKPKSPAKTKAPKKKQREVVELDDDVEAFAPAINVDDDEPTKPSPPKRKKARGKKQESSDDDDDADEDTKRRLRMLRESRAAREAMRQAERKVENLAESDDEPVVAQPTRRRRVQVEAPPKPVQPKYGGALLKIKIRTEGDAKPLDYEIREDEPFAELFERYACDRGVNAYDCKFVFDGEVVGAGSKPRALDMESEDMIDCKAPPRGRKRPRPGEAPAQPSPAKPAAAPSAKKKRASPKAPPQKEKVKVILVFDKGDGSKPKKFKIWNTDEFRKVFDVYRKSVKGVVSFSYLGAALNPNATPGDHGIETQGKIDVRS